MHLLELKGVTLPDPHPELSSSLVTTLRKARALHGLAQILDVVEYAKVQRQTPTDCIDLVAALPTENIDRHLLVFTTSTQTEASWFTGVLYLSEEAAGQDGITDALHREIPTLGQSYWFNAEWPSWTFPALMRRPEFQAIPQVILTALAIVAK